MARAVLASMVRGAEREEQGADDDDDGGGGKEEAAGCVRCRRLVLGKGTHILLLYVCV